MASNVFIWTRLTKLAFSSVQQTAGCILQRHSVAFSRTLSSFPLARFLGNTSSDSRSEKSNPTSSLFLCGSQGQGTVLVNNFITQNALQIRSYRCMVKPVLMCDGCYFVWRHGRKFVECSDHPRHKQMKRLPTRKIWQEDYSKGDISKAHDWHKRFPREFYRCADRTALSHNWLAGKLGKEL